MTIKSQFPTLKVRDQHYLFTPGVIDKVTGVDLILSSCKTKVYAAPYVKVNSVKIHCCKYGYLVADINSRVFTVYTRQTEVTGWESSMVKDGINEKIINRTRELVDKSVRAENWYYEY